MTAPLVSQPLSDAASRVLAETETPFVAIDRRRLSANIARVAEIARAGMCRLRPHIKTHKSPVIARQQLAAGAVGVTSAKCEEALVFLNGGVPSLTLAHPLVDPAKVARLLRAAADRAAEVRFIADSLVGIEAIASAARAAGRQVPVFLKIDVGLGRCGVPPESAAAPQLAQAIARTPGLVFQGLLAHAGHAYGAGTAEGVRRAAAAERLAMTGLAESLRRSGLDVPEVSVGSTPTVLANAGLDGITEIRPGNYVFLDLTQVALGVAGLTDVALSVVGTVVSRNDTYAIIDAGSKVLSSDRGPHGSDALQGYGLAFAMGAGQGEAGLPVAKLSEEHGFVAHAGRELRIGSRLRVFPNHACVVANLARSLWAFDADGGIEEWPVEARALVH